MRIIYCIMIEAYNKDIRQKLTLSTFVELLLLSCYFLIKSILLFHYSGVKMVEKNWCPN
jgi:hypothetical protein